jgi:hypothetical protein
MAKILRKKPGLLGEAFLGKDAYEEVEVSEEDAYKSGLIYEPTSQIIKNSWTTSSSSVPQQVAPRSYPARKKSKVGRPNEGKTPPKLDPGIRAPSKGHTTPFNYHAWNKLRQDNRLKPRRNKK